MAPSSHVGQRIRELRSDRGLSQEQLAGPGVSASYVSLIESGHRRPSRSALDSIAAALGTTADFLEHGDAAVSRRRAELSLRHAQLLLDSGAAAEAETRFRALLADDVDLSVRRPAHQGLAAALENQGALEQAIAVYEELRTQAEVSHDADWVGATIALVRCYREVGDLGRSADLGERMLERLASLGLPRTELHLNLAASVAFTAYERGDLVRARQLAEQALENALASESRRAQGAAYWNASVIAAERGDVGAAIAMSERALLLFAEDGDTRNAARLRNSYAELLLRTEPREPRRALDLLRSAVDSLEGLGSLTDLAYCHTEIARAHLQLGDPKAAIDAARTALHNLPAADERLERSRALVVLAEAWLDAGDGEAAAEAYREAARTLGTAGAGRQAAKVWHQLADHLERTGDLPGAMAALKAAGAAVGLRSVAESSAAVPRSP